MKQRFRKTGTGMLLALALSSCGFSWQQEGNGGREYKPLAVATGERTLTRKYAATVQGRQSVEVRPQVSGTITDICIDEGAKVRKGQTLLVIDQVPYRAALATAEAGRLSVQNSLYDIRRQISETENSLSALLGRVPGRIERGTLDGSGFPQELWRAYRWNC